MKFRNLPILNTDKVSERLREEQFTHELIKRQAVVGKKDNSDVYSQINQILTGVKPKFSTVDEVVLDLRKRTGLANYLNQISAKDSDASQTKIAEEDDTPKAFKQCKDIKIFIDNYIEDRPGLAIQAIIEAIPKYLKMKLSDDALEDENLKKYINKVVQVEENDVDDQNSTNLGKLDTTDSDIQEDNDLFAGFSKK